MKRPSAKQNDSVLGKNRAARWLCHVLLVGVLATINILQSISIKNRNLEYTPPSIPLPLLQLPKPETETETDIEYYRYYFPSKPLLDIYSILNESIGTTILNDPQQNPLRNCSPTVQYRLIIPSTSTKDTVDTWILQSMMMMTPSPTNNTSSTHWMPPTITSTTPVVPKSYGGDEIYVQWEAATATDHNDGNDVNDDDYIGVAQVTDQKDGTYLLKFIRPPMLQYNYTKNRLQKQQQEMIESIDSNNTHQEVNDGEVSLPPKLPVSSPPYGRLTIYYEYTCGIGSLFAPHKDQYTRGGEVFQILTLTTTSNHSNVSSTTQLVPRPYIHDFIPPNTIDDSSSKERIDFSKYDRIIAFGDSLIAQLVRRYSGEGSWSSNILWYQNVCQCLSSDKDASDMIYKLHTRHGHQIRRQTKRNARIALITGSSSWDAMRGCVHTDMKDHIHAIRTFIQNVTTSYPNVHIYWKAPSAFFLHRYTTYIDAFNETYFQTLKPKYGIVPLKPRYINYHVPSQLYRVQKELMTQELHIPFLDLYDSYYLSAPWTVPGDARHFDDTLTRLQLSYFWPGLLNQPIYVKR